MRHSFLLFIFIFFSVLTRAQKINLPEGFKQQAFQPDYSWQSKYLFDYDVHFYGLNLSISPDTTFVKGNVTIGATLLVSKCDTFAIELIPEMRIDSAFLNGQKLSKPVRKKDNVLFSIPTLLKKGTSFNIKIFYQGTVPTGNFFSGVSTAYNKRWKKHVAWSLSEPFAAKTWFPVKEVLTDKADSAWVFLTVDSNYMAGSQGLLTKVIDLGNGKKRYEWKTHYPIDYYLLSFAVADYQDFSFYAYPDNPAGDSVLIQNFIYRSSKYLQQYRNDILRTAQFIELYVKLFGPYPFRKEKYGHCLTELAGGMENQTMTTLGDFGFDLVAHELGHMWFGDNVTCADWSDIWVNEGFATYADYLANEYILGEKIATKFMIKAQQKAMSEPGGSIYIPKNEIYMGNELRIFNGRLSYDKGAAIIHMLRHEVNDDSLFFQILKTYQSKFAGHVATGEDFKTVVDELTHKNFDWFFKQWYYGEGYPVFDVSWYQTEDTLHILSLETSSVSTTSFFNILEDYRFIFSNGTDTIQQYRQSKSFNEYSFPLHGRKVVALEIDPKHWNLQKINSLNYIYVKVNNSPLQFEINPVPVSRWVYVRFIHFINGIVKIDVFDINGRCVLSTNTFGKSLKLDLSRLESGVYIIRASYKGNFYYQKVLRQ